MKTHVEIRFRLRPAVDLSLHAVLRKFASQTPGWSFPTKQSKDYQLGRNGEAGFVECSQEEGLECAAIAIANTDTKRPNKFRTTNIIPRKIQSLTLAQYNAIGLKFAHRFRHWCKKNLPAVSIEVVGPNKTLADIIPGEKGREFFQAWLQSPTPIGHPSDLYLLDLFICHLFRHPGSVYTYEIESFLIEDRNWSPNSARRVAVRIDTGLELLRVDRRF